VVGVLLALLYLQLFTFCLTWLWMVLAVSIRDATAAQGVVYLLQFLLIFASNVMAPLHTMPGWLEAVVKVNPVTQTATVVRGLMHDTLTAGQLGSGLIACAALLVLFVPPSVYLYNRKHG
jgi:ABC-2 type transport system permease protein